MRKRGWWSLLSVVVVLPLLLAAGSCDLTDTDGDGVPDQFDLCPTEPGSWDQLGCPVTPAGEYDCENPPATSGFVPVAGAIHNRFVVVMKPQTGRLSISTVAAQALASKYKVEAVTAFSRGFVGTIRVGTLQKVEKAGVTALVSLLRDPAVKYVTQEAKVKLIQPKKMQKTARVAASLPWDLDRIDARKGLDGIFAPTGKGKGIHFVVSDTGVTETNETKGRVSAQCYSTVIYRGCEDEHGHGSFVSSEGIGLTLGVLSEAIAHSLRFLGKDGSGTTGDALLTFDELLKWKAADPTGLFVVNASWGGPPDPAIDDGVCRLIAAGIPFVAAAGNEESDAYESSPARVKQAITVLAMDRNDKMAYFSNYGAGIDVGAPGVDVMGMLPGGSVEAWNGTSMAAPLVTAAVALYLEAHPDATVAEVHDFIISNATKDVLSGLPEGTPNRLVFVGKE